jgi:hypothetical protein
VGKGVDSTYKHGYILYVWRPTVEAKLTLKLDSAVIESAKRYAQKNNRSLSRMVENFFRNLSSEHKYSGKHSSVVNSLTGILSQDDLEKFAKEDERARYILKREI